MRKLTIVGGGPGGAVYLTERARHAIESAQLVLASERFGEVFPKAVVCGLAEMSERLAGTDCPNSTVIVSGDAGFYSLSTSLIKRFARDFDIEVVNGIGSLPYLMSRLKLPYDNVKAVSLHGRDYHGVCGLVAYHARVFFLLDGKHTPSAVCRNLTASGLGQVRVYVGERLSYPDEAITEAAAAELTEAAFDPLSVMLVVNEGYSRPHTALRDSDFVRGASPMTKENIRWLVLQKLRISPEDILYDIGAGTGSVAVEMARRATEGFVWAFERDAEACGLIDQNRKKHGAYNLQFIHGEAPVEDDALPPPDGVFIGGSGGSMKSILRWVSGKNADVRIVITAIALETVTESMAALQSMGYHPEIECVQISTARPTGRLHMMAANNPVYILWAEKRKI